MQTLKWSSPLAFIFLSTCNNEIPPASKDAPPKITIGSTDPTGKFSKNYTGDATVMVTQGTKLIFVSSAYNSGGVKNHVLSISSPSITTLRTGQPDAQGKVPPQLQILNDDHGNIIQTTFNAPGQVVQVIATSENFNFMQSKITLSFQVPQLPPKINYLKFTKRLPPKGNGEEDGYITLGESTDILWSISNCAPGCTVSLKAMDGGFATTVFDVTGLPATGSYKVTPRDEWTKYFLTVSSVWGSDHKEVIQQLAIPH